MPSALPRPRSNCPLLPKMGSLQRGRRVKSRRREGGILKQLVRPRHDGGMAPGAIHNARGASGKNWSRGRRGVRKATPRDHRSPPGGPISVASTAAVAAEAATIVAPEVTAATETRAGTFPRLLGDLRGTWRVSASSPQFKANKRGPSRGT